jgi:hypothetical protein
MTPRNLFITATARSPEVNFDFDTGRFRVKGESYPEDAARFFGPLLQAVQDHIAARPGAKLLFDIELVYFNSSTAKALMNLFQLLEDAAEEGSDVLVNWHFASDDDAMREFGEDFAEDFDACIFNLCPDAG